MTPETDRPAAPRGGWRALFARLTESERRDLREILAENYAAEIRHARELARYGEQLSRYPDRRQRLLEIAAREEEHARWLREAIERLGGKAPEPPASPPDDRRTNWERLIEALEREKDAAERLLQEAYMVERDHPDIARLLQRISEEETAHQRELVWLIARFTDRVVLDRAP